jgi:hypothetical protein
LFEVPLAPLDDQDKWLGKRLKDITGAQKQFNGKANPPMDLRYRRGDTPIRLHAVTPIHRSPGSQILLSRDLVSPCYGSCQTAWRGTVLGFHF